MQNENYNPFLGTSAPPFQRVDSELLSAIQVNNFETLRRISVFIFDATNLMSQRHAEFLSASGDQTDRMFDEHLELLNTNDLSRQRVALYQEVMESLARHTEDLMEISLKCCGDVLQQVGGNISDQSADTAKCCCGSSSDKAREGSKETNPPRKKQSPKGTHGHQPVKAAAAE